MTDPHDLESYLAQFRARLKSLRLLQGLTQSDLAEKADISIEHVSKLERGGASPSFKTICSLAKALETEPASLFLFEPPEETPGLTKTSDVMNPPLSPYISNMGSFEHDLVTNSLFFSQEMRRILGMDPGEKLGTAAELISRFFHPDDQGRVFAALDNVTKGIPVSSLEFRFIRADAQVRYGLLHCEPETDGSGQPIVARGVFLDVTELMRMETLLHKSRINLEGKVRRDQEQLQATAQELDDERRESGRLKESIALFHRLIAASKDYISFVDSTHTYRALSDSYRVITGKDPKTLVDRPVQQVLDQDLYRKHIKKNLEHAMRGNAVRYQTWVDTPTNGRRFLDVSYHPYVQDGRILGIVALSRDDTERKLAEEALTQSEERYRLLADTMADVIWTMDTNFRVDYVSPSLERLVGYTPKEFLAMSYEERLAPESLALIYEYFDLAREALRSGDWSGLPRLIEQEHLHKNGSSVWTEVLWSPRFGPDKEFLGITGMSRDISARRAAEAELRERDATYRLLAENMSDVIWTLDENYSITWMSPSAQTLLGYTPEEVAGLEREQRYPPSSVTRFRELVQQVSQAEKDGNWDRVDRVFEIEHIRKDGSTVWTEIVWTPLQDQNGRYMGATGVTRNIDERRRAQEALKQSEQRFRLLAENMPVLLHAHDNEGRYVFWNKECERVTGYTAREAMAEDFEQRLFPDPDYRAEIRSYYQDFSHRFRNKEFDWRCADGAVRTIAWSNISPDCPVPGWAMWETGVDVTERRAAEEALAQSEEDFRFLAENSRAAIFRMSLPDGNYEYMSPAVREITGYEAVEFLQSPMKVAEILHPDFKDFFAQAWQDLLQGRTQPTSLYKIFNASGQERWIEQHNTLIRDDQGRAVGFEGVAMDVTPRIQAEEELRQSEARYRLLFEYACDAIYVHDMQGRFLDVNTLGCERLGYTREELLALTPKLIDTPAEAVNVEERFKILEDKGSIAFETTHRRKDGSRVASDVRATMISLAGEPAVLAIVRDDTDRKRREGKLMLAKQQAESDERSKSQFLACLSHEIHTPLAKVLDMLQFMGLSPLSWEQRRYLDMAVDSSRSLLKIMTEILDLSGVEAGTQPLRQEPFTVPDFLEALLGSVRPKAEAKGLALTLHVAPEVPETLAGDPYRLHQVLSSLLANCLQNTQQGAIRLSAAKGQGQGGQERLLLTLTDTRPILEDQDPEDLFVPCFPPLGEESQRMGHGLSLAIARRLVLAMGGDIAASSPGGKGLGFTLHVPALQPPKAEVETRSPCDPAKGLYIFVVDDDETNLFTISSMLKHLGHSSTTLASGEEVLKALRESPCDLVLMDIRMPGMNGLETTRRIRAANAPWSQVPVAAITAHALEGDQDHCLAHGMNGYLAKPINMDDLEALIEKLCRSEK